MEWTPTNIENAKTLGQIEFVIDEQAKRDSKGRFTGEVKKEYALFDVVYTKERVVFGGCCNAGFLESGYIEREDYESLDETLQEMLEDLKVYYQDGPTHVSRIVCNERM